MPREAPVTRAIFPERSKGDMGDVAETGEAGKGARADQRANRRVGPRLRLKSPMRKFVLLWLLVSTLGLAVLVALVLKRPASPARALLNRGLVEPVVPPLRLASPVPGVVQAVAVQVGATVAAGDILIQLDDREARALLGTQQAALLAQEARLKSAEVQLAERTEQLRRIELLRRDNSTSESEAQRGRFAQQTAEAGLAQARAELTAIQAQLGRAQAHLEMLTIRAPRSGSILQILVRPGESATPAVIGEPLLLLGDTLPLQVRATLAEATAQRVQAGAKARAFVPGQRDRPFPLAFQRVEALYLPRTALPDERPERLPQVIFQCDSAAAAHLRPGQLLEIAVE